MRTATALAFIAVAFIAVSLAALPADAKTKTHRHVHQAGQIACTPSGCQRIPPNCHPEQSYNFNGIPTGFDMVVCRR